MNAKVEAKEYRLDGLKWLLVVGIIIGASVANSYYAADVELIFRAIAWVVVGAIACFIGLQTQKGQAFWTLVREAQVEIRKVVWPTNAETNQTTMLVSLVVIIAAIFLSVIDLGIGQVAEMIIG